MVFREGLAKENFMLALSFSVIDFINAEIFGGMGCSSPTHGINLMGILCLILDIRLIIFLKQ